MADQECPQCESFLNKGATKCLCGWNSAPPKMKKQRSKPKVTRQQSHAMYTPPPPVERLPADEVVKQIARLKSILNGKKPEVSHG